MSDKNGDSKKLNKKSKSNSGSDLNVSDEASKRKHDDNNKSEEPVEKQNKKDKDDVSSEAKEIITHVCIGKKLFSFLFILKMSPQFQSIIIVVVIVDTYGK